MKFLRIFLLALLCVGAEEAHRLSAPPSISESATGKRTSPSQKTIAARPSPNLSESNRETNSDTGSETSTTTTSSAPKPPSTALNTPGEDVDFSSYLNNGRVSIVYFYADWCPACRQLSPALANINSNSPDTQVLFLNIAAWDSPIADRYGIRYVPYLRVYDRNGSLIAEGKEANAWLQSKF